MSDTMQLLLLFGSWLLVCVGSHVCIRRYYLASFVAAVLCVAVTLYAGYAELGHPVLRHSLRDLTSGVGYEGHSELPAGVN